MASKKTRLFFMIASLILSLVCGCYLFVLYYGRYTEERSWQKVGGHVTSATYARSYGYGRSGFFKLVVPHYRVSVRYEYPVADRAFLGQGEKIIFFKSRAESVIKKYPIGPVGVFVNPQEPTQSRLAGFVDDEPYVYGFIFLCLVTVINVIIFRSFKNRYE